MVQSSLLVVDSIATNRVAMKVELSSSWYDVNVASTGEEAIDKIKQLKPNLVLVNNTLSDMHIAEISATLKAQLGLDAPPILALTELAETRETLLRSGVEDVLTLPVDHSFLVARIRSILRTRAAESEWRLRDSTTRALGFAEPLQSFQSVISVMCMHGQKIDAPLYTLGLANDKGIAFRCEQVSFALRDQASTTGASVIILGLPESAPERALSILSDLRAGANTRQSAIIAIVPKDRPDLAAQALDLGADDAALDTIPPGELVLRTRRLNTRRQATNGMRKIVIDGAEAATRDHLTGLYNRRYALPQLERVMEQARLSGRPFTVMIADLDHFKRVNDWYGHKAGDAVLVECARRLQDNVRSTDLLARIGGEEFLIVMPNCDQNFARKTALRLCQHISDIPVRIPDLDKTVPMTVSIGMTMCDPGDPNVGARRMRRVSSSELLCRADKALYKAKETGRNRFMVERSAA